MLSGRDASACQKKGTLGFPPLCVIMHPTQTSNPTTQPRHVSSFDLVQSELVLYAPDRCAAS